MLAEIKSSQVLAQNFVQQSLLNGDEAEVRRFLVDNNKGPVFQITKSRTICLMDATGSMAERIAEVQELRTDDVPESIRESSQQVRASQRACSG